MAGTDLEDAVQELLRIGRAQDGELGLGQVEAALPVGDLDVGTLARLIERLEAEGLSVELDEELTRGAARPRPVGPDALPYTVAQPGAEPPTAPPAARVEPRVVSPGRPATAAVGTDGGRTARRPVMQWLALACVVLAALVLILLLA